MMFVYFNEEKWEEAANAKNVPTVLEVKDGCGIGTKARLRNDGSDFGSSFLSERNLPCLQPPTATTQGRRFFQAARARQAEGIEHNGRWVDQSNNKHNIKPNPFPKACQEYIKECRSHLRLPPPRQQVTL